MSVFSKNICKITRLILENPAAHHFVCLFKDLGLVWPLKDHFHFHPLIPIPLKTKRIGPAHKGCWLCYCFKSVNSLVLGKGPMGSISGFYPKFGSSLV